MFSNFWKTCGEETSVEIRKTPKCRPIARSERSLKFLVRRPFPEAKVYSTISADVLTVYDADVSSQ
jgi:hypothetical protein